MVEKLGCLQQGLRGVGGSCSWGDVGGVSVGGVCGGCRLVVSGAVNTERTATGPKFVLIGQLALSHRVS